MKKFAFTTTAVLCGLTQWAAAAEANAASNTPAPANPPANCCTPDGSCKPCTSPCSMSDKGIQCGEQAWLDIETVTIEAANGDPIAQYTVAYLMEADDEPSPEDLAAAREWYAKALPGLEKKAAAGDASACCALAHMYAEGKGVDKNPEMAAKYKKMYEEICAAKHKKAHDKKPCCPQGPGPAMPPAN